MNKIADVLAVVALIFSAVAVALATDNGLKLSRIAIDLNARIREVVEVATVASSNATKASNVASNARTAFDLYRFDLIRAGVVEPNETPPIIEPFKLGKEEGCE